MSIDGKEGQPVAGNSLALAHKHKWLVVTSDGYRKRLGPHPDAAAGAKGYIVKVYENGAGHKVDVFWDNGKLLTGYQASEGVYDLLIASSDEKEQEEAKTPLRKRVMGKLRNRSLSASGRSKSASRVPLAAAGNLKDAHVDVIVGYLGKAPEAHKSGAQFSLWDDESPTMKYNQQQQQQQLQQHRPSAASPGGAGRGAMRDGVVPPQPRMPAPVTPVSHGREPCRVPVPAQAPARSPEAGGGPPTTLHSSPAKVLEQLQVPLPSPPPLSIMGYQPAGKGALQQFAVPPPPLSGESAGTSGEGVSPSSTSRNSDGGDSARLSAASTAADSLTSGNWDHLLC